MPQIEIELIAKIEKLKDGVDKANASLASISKQTQSVSESSKTMSDSFNWAALAGGAAAAAIVVKKVAEAAFDCANEFMQSEKAAANLANSMKSLGVYSRESVKELTDFAGVMQKNTVFEDDLVVSQMAILQSFKLNNTEIKAATKAATDLAASGLLGADSQSALSTAVMLVGKAAVGETGTLSRYGIVIKDGIPDGEKFAEVLKQINERFGGRANSEIETNAGQIAQLANRWKDVKEYIGEAVINKIAWNKIAYAALALPEDYINKEKEIKKNRENLNLGVAKELGVKAFDDELPFLERRKELQEETESFMFQTRLKSNILRAEDIEKQKELISLGGALNMKETERLNIMHSVLEDLNLSRPELVKQLSEPNKPVEKEETQAEIDARILPKKQLLPDREGFEKWQEEEVKRQYVAHKIDEDILRSTKEVTREQTLTYKKQMDDTNALLLTQNNKKINNETAINRELEEIRKRSALAYADLEDKLTNISIEADIKRIESRKKFYEINDKLALERYNKEKPKEEIFALTKVGLNPREQREAEERANTAGKQMLKEDEQRNILKQGRIKDWDTIPITAETEKQIAVIEKWKEAGRGVGQELGMAALNAQRMGKNMGEALSELIAYKLEAMAVSTIFGVIGAAIGAVIGAGNPAAIAAGWQLGSGTNKGSFDVGGPIPGRRGEAIDIEAHGGEWILPTHRMSPERAIAEAAIGLGVNLNRQIYLPIPQQQSQKAPMQIVINQHSDDYRLPKETADAIQNMMMLNSHNELAYG